MIDIKEINEYENISTELGIQGQTADEIAEKLSKSSDSKEKIKAYINNHEDKILELKSSLNELKDKYHNEYDEITKKIEEAKQNRDNEITNFKNYISLLNDDVATEIRQREIDDIEYKLKEIEEEELIGNAPYETKEELESKKEELSNFENKYMQLEKDSLSKYRNIMKTLKEYQNEKDQIVEDYLSRKKDIEVEIRNVLTEKIKGVEVLYKLKEKEQVIENKENETKEESVENLFEILNDHTDEKENVQEEIINKPVPEEEMHEIFADNFEVPSVDEPELLSVEDNAEEKLEEPVTHEVPTFNENLIEEPTKEETNEQPNENVNNEVELPKEPEEMHEVFVEESKISDEPTEELPELFNIEENLLGDYAERKESEPVANEISTFNEDLVEKSEKEETTEQSNEILNSEVELPKKPEENTIEDNSVEIKEEKLELPEIEETLKNDDVEIEIPQINEEQKEDKSDKKEHKSFKERRKEKKEKKKELKEKKKEKHSEEELVENEVVNTNVEEIIENPSVEEVSDNSNQPEESINNDETEIVSDTKEELASEEKEETIVEDSNKNAMDIFKAEPIEDVKNTTSNTIVKVDKTSELLFPKLAKLYHDTRYEYLEPENAKTL